jgi:hypothetical protein
MRSIAACREIAVACVVWLGVGCVVSEDDLATDDGLSDVAAEDIETVTFDDVALAPSDGRSALLQLTVPSGTESFTIYIFGAGLETAYLVDHLEGPKGERLVSEDPPGLTDEQRMAFPFGAGQFFSPNRAMAQEGFASLLVPNAPDISIAPGKWRLRVRGVRVDAQGTVHAATDAPDVAVVMKSRSAGPANRRRELKVHFYLTGSHGLTAASAAGDARFAAAMSELTDVYARAGIDVKVVGTDDIDPRLQEVKETDLMTPFLPAMADVDTVPVVMVGEFWEPRMAGFSTGMPGPVFVPAAPYRAVFVSNRPPEPAVPSTPMGLAMAHELGHYLGLPHTFDESAILALDPFDDTSDQLFSGNLMEPGGIDLSRTPGPIHLSEQQIDLLRRSPAVR